MEMKELLTKSAAELNQLLTEKKDKLRDLRFKDSNKQLKNVREIRVLKADLARIMTLLNKKD
jgi:ribosomal protein L29